MGAFGLCVWRHGVRAGGRSLGTRAWGKPKGRAAQGQPAFALCVDSPLMLPGNGTAADQTLASLPA